MRHLALVKRVMGWIATIGLPLALITSFPLSSVMIHLSNQQLLWLTGAWVALSWLSLISLAGWLLCWLINVVLMLRRKAS